MLKGEMDSDLQHLSAALRVLDDTRTRENARVEAREAYEQEHLAEVRLAQREPLADLLRELRALWREGAAAHPDEPVSVQSQWRPVPFLQGSREAQLSMASDPQQGTLSFVIHLPGRSWMLWHDSELPDASSWARRVDRQIAVHGRAVLAGVLPPLSL